MDIKISTQEYEIIKDGVIVAEASDRISFKFEDLNFNIELQDSNKEEKSWATNLMVSEDKKNITIPIKISWDYLSTNFSDRIKLLTFEEGNKKKELSLTYAINGLDGETIKVYVFKYTFFIKDLSK